MASPQRENGHVDLANEIVDKLCAYRLSGEEWQVLWVILRKTYGWHKKQDKIALSQFNSMTGLTRSRACLLLSKLVTRGVIKKDNTIPVTYSFVKDYEIWKVLPKKVTALQVLPKKTMGVTNIGNQVLPLLGHTKETITKETITKESRPKALLTDLEFIQNLKASIAYKHINIDIELAKMDAFLMTRPNRKKTRRFIVAWLNRIDRPINLRPETKPQTRIDHEKEKSHDPVLASMIHETARKMK